MPKRFFFDYADKDKSNSLDIAEIKELFNQFPGIFKKNRKITSITKQLQKKNNKSLTKEEFLELFEENIKSRKFESEQDLINKSRLIDSVIFEKEKEFRDLMSLCDFEDQKWRLIYRASKDGFRAKDFHEKCDDTFNTLTIIKTTNLSVFGGYTRASWSKEEGFKEDEDSFIFSLTNNHNKPLLIPCTNFSEAIKCETEFGVCFGNGDLVISNASNLNIRSHSKLTISYGDKEFFEKNSINPDTFLAGSENFQTTEIEVFRKDYKELSQVQSFKSLFDFLLQKF